MSDMHDSARKQLRSFIERIERLEEEKKGITDDIRNVLLEAKSTGFDVKAMRKIIRLRRKSKAERDEEEAILATYMHALDGTPMGEYLARSDESAGVRAA